MSLPEASAAPSVQLRTVPVSAIVPIEGWNPRTAFDDGELQALSSQTTAHVRRAGSSTARQPTRSMIPLLRSRATTSSTASLCERVLTLRHSDERSPGR